MHLRLMINNTDDLSGGYSAIKDFDEGGGVIGASPGSTWQIVDRHGSIADTHVLVHFIDKQFCLETPVKKGMALNRARSFIAPGEQVQITDGDILQIGIFELTAYVEMTIGEAKAPETHNERWARRFVSVGSLVDSDKEEGITALNFFESKAMKCERKITIREAAKRAQNVDPINLIEENCESRSTNEVDPVKLFDRDMQAERNIMASKLGDIINVEPEETGSAEIPDNLHPGSAYMDIPGVKAAKGERKELQAPPKQGEAGEDMDSYLEKLSNSAHSIAESQHGDAGDIITRDHYLGGIAVEDGNPDAQVDHVLLRPLCAALGLPVHKITVPQANRLMSDIGAALRAAIGGLMDAHQQALSNKSHLAETHLHAIEDNPLRFGKDVGEVTENLFLVKSPVHLSAAAAIKESLELLQYHQQASKAAVNEALEAVLRALGPAALAKRFKKYKGHAPRAGDPDAWHWEMYQHYYREIRSEQQGGLSRMFWEVYRQVYDREMREQSLEG